VLNSLRQWELDLGVVELLHLGPATVRGLHNLHLDYLYGVGTRPMTGTHVPVTLRHCATDGEVPVLSVHVMCTRSGIVSQPDPKVFDFNWCFFRDLK